MPISVFLSEFSQVELVECFFFLVFLTKNIYYNQILDVKTFKHALIYLANYTVITLELTFWRKRLSLAFDASCAILYSTLA